MSGVRQEIRRREVAIVALAALAIAVVMHWPLALNLGTDVPKDLADPLAQAWQPAWGGHALATQPFEFFQSNQFWPARDSLAFSDALVGYAPAGLIGSGPEAAIGRYGVLFLFAYALAFFGAYVLARELGLGPAAAAVAGVAFAFAPFRLAQDGHLHVISSGGIPLALALGLRGYRLRSPDWVIGGFAVAAWQLAIGFSLGLPFAYLLALLGVIAAVVWLRAGRPPLPRRLVIATLAGATLFAGTAVVLSRPYERAAEANPQANRSPEDVESFSEPVRGLVLAPRENEVWGGLSARIGSETENAEEKTLFPGLVIAALALAGLGSAALGRRVRLGLGAGVAGATILALGFQAEDGILWPYRIVYEALPGWEGIRTPGRLATFSTLALALLAGAGAARVLAKRRGRQAAALAGVLALLVVIEGRGLPFDPFDAQAQPRAPVEVTPTADVPAPQLHIPADRPEDNRRYLLWSTDGFPEIVNGRSSIKPLAADRLIVASRSFPDAASVRALRAAGVRSVILHRDRAPGTAWVGAATKPVRGLGLRIERRGELVIFGLGPGAR